MFDIKWKILLSVKEFFLNIFKLPKSVQILFIIILIQNFIIHFISIKKHAGLVPQLDGVSEVVMDNVDATVLDSGAS